MNILLSFDIEEFDAPLENGGTLAFEEQISYSIQGTERVLELLNKYNLKATFYCTTTFAMCATSLVKQIVQSGHELASHGCKHGSFHIDDLAKSKQYLEEHFRTHVYGYRMARMMELDLEAVTQAGYLYDSSLNPTFIPGRYNHLSQPRSLFKKNNLWILPASVSSIFRLPLFWLSLHNFPLPYYYCLAKRAAKKDGYLNVYFHPWEFIDCLGDQALKLPRMIVRNSGKKMLKRLEYIIKRFLLDGATFSLSYKFVEQNSTK